MPWEVIAFLSFLVDGCKDLIDGASHMQLNSWKTRLEHNTPLSIGCKHLSDNRDNVPGFKEWFGTDG